MARMAVMRMNALGATSFVWEQWVSQPVREALNATAEQTIVLTINKHSPQVTVLSQIPQIVSKVTYSRSRLVPRPLLTSLLAHLPPPPPPLPTCPHSNWLGYKDQPTSPKPLSLTFFSNFLPPSFTPPPLLPSPHPSSPFLTSPPSSFLHSSTPPALVTSPPLSFLPCKAEECKHS